MIVLKNITKIYNKGKHNEHTALKDVSLSIAQGELVSIMGKSGAGKSTMLHLLACIDKYDNGQLLINNKDIGKLNEKQLSKIRSEEISIILQDYFLINELTVEENVEVPLLLTSSNKSERITKARNILNQLDMLDKNRNKISELSGGEKQRVAIARALITEPNIILADEPTGSLDEENTNIILNILKNINKSGKTIIIITHDREIANHCNRIITIKDGKIELDQINSKTY